MHKLEIINAPDNYFSAQKKTLDARLDKIALPEDEVSKIVYKKSKDIIRDKVLGSFKIGEIINTVLTWNESIDEELKKAKKEYLLAYYFDLNEQNSLSLHNLKDFLTNAQGNTIYNKILRILDDTPPDLELSQHLSNALSYIVNSDFKMLFDNHKYALSQIEKLTPQALTILADQASWPKITLGSYASTGGKITSDWLVEFTQAYSAKKGLQNSDWINRVQHSINQLISERLIEAHLVAERVAESKTTSIGKLLLPYLNSNIAH